MFGLFGGSKPTKVVNKPFSAFLGGIHFASISLPDDPKMDVATNLQGVLYMCGEQEIAVMQNHAVTNNKHELQIERVSGNVSDRVEASVQKKDIQFMQEYSCFLGIADYKGSPQAVFVKTAKLALQYKGHNIFVVHEVEAIDLREGQVQTTFTSSLDKLFSSNYYFSFTLNITQRLTATKDKLRHQHRNYWWGETMLSTFPTEGLKKKWNVHLTAGYFKQHQLNVGGHQFEITLTGRKSTQEGSVYPHNFGVNSLGECANYISFEVIVTRENKSIWYSYSTSTPPVDVSISPDNQVIPNCCERKLRSVSEASVKWFIKREDGCNQWVMMRNAKEPDFGKFNRFIDEIIENNQGQNLRMIDVDLNDIPSMTKSDMFVCTLLQLSVHDSIMKQRVVDLADHPEGFKSTRDVLNGHTHACVFSLQYSNFLIHTAVIYTMLIRSLEVEELQLSQPDFDRILNIAKHIEYSLLVLYDRGRAKSLSPKDMGGRYNLPLCSTSRNANTTFADRCLGSSISLDEARTRKVFGKAKPENVTKVKTKVAVISWNVAGFSPTNPEQIDGLRGCFDKDNMPDIITIGLQEVVELKSSNIARFFTSNSKENDDWVRCIEETIAKLDPNYEKLNYQRMVGLFSLTLVHKNFRQNVYDLGIQEVKTGFMGIVGNKGSVITTLKVCDSLIHFCNTHLPSGDSVGKRANCVEDLYKEFCIDQKCDTFFLFGDLNFRVQIDLLIYKNMMEDFVLSNPKINFNALMAKDEVKLNLHPCLSDNFIEAPLPKAPTYRLTRNTEKFSEDRVASWCDRVFYHTSKDFHCSGHHSKFDSLRMNDSDHWPVYGIYEFEFADFHNTELHSTYKDLVREEKQKAAN